MGAGSRNWEFLYMLPRIIKINSPYFQEDPIYFRIVWKSPGRLLELLFALFESEENIRSSGSVLIFMLLFHNSGQIS